jgi:DNA-binding PadR family transcriptional regulator
MTPTHEIPNQREAIILAILFQERYGREIRDEFEKRTGRTMPLGSLYTTLDRMEDKGFLRSRMGESASERGGNRRKYYKITGEGVSGLNRLQQMTSTPKGAPANA